MKKARADTSPTETKLNIMDFNIFSVNGTEEFKDENSVNDVLASNYTFGEFDNQSILQPTLYNCGNESFNCTEESDTEGYFYKVCNIVFKYYLYCLFCTHIW